MQNRSHLEVYKNIVLEGGSELKCHGDKPTNSGKLELALCIFYGSNATTVQSSCLIVTGCRHYK